MSHFAHSRLRLAPLALLAAAGGFVALAPLARADTLALKDGRVVEGRVTKDGETYRVVSRFGESEFPAKDVVTWTKAASVEAEWRTRSSRLDPKDAAGRADLAKWLADSGRPEEGAATARAALEIDPESAVAHGVLGHVRHKGAWMTPEEAKRADGFEEHGGRWYTPAEWALASQESRSAAADADRAAANRRVAVRVNEAVRAMMSPDPLLRAKGKQALLDLAKETKTVAYESLAQKVEAYAAASDRFAAAVDAGGATGGSTASVLAECRIQMATLKRPIQTLQTSLASNLSGAGVLIQLPEVEVIRVDTTVKIPAGSGP